MPLYPETTFINWSKPARRSEETRISNAIQMIKDAINSHHILKDFNIEPVVQGSYANNTNVRLNSDVDVTIMLKDTFYSKYPDGLTREDYGFSEGTNKFNTYRKYIIQAISNKFKPENIKVGNKSLKIDSNSYHVQADAVPSFQYRNYKSINSKNPDKYLEGIKFYSSNGNVVINYPKIHIKNGKQKNKDTLRRYKRAVRIYKRVRNQMIKEGIPVSKEITSFLLECLLWNVSNDIFLKHDTWNGFLRESIAILHNATKNETISKGWVEVSERFYLFHSGRKWTQQGAKNFLYQMWNFLGYK